MSAISSSLNVDALSDPISSPVIQDAALMTYESRFMSNVDSIIVLLFWTGAFDDICYRFQQYIKLSNLKTLAQHTSFSKSLSVTAVASVTGLCSSFHFQVPLFQSHKNFISEKV
jgi:hypothetical protein